ncbi:MAG: hypothetical protein KDI36_12830, partial [Pseudomonadales bacterium]|nr:hypothetical protein [Pseudomonadales bacterium]
KDIQHNLADFQRNPVISEEFRTNYTQILRANFHSLVTLLAGTEAEQRLSHYETLQKEIRQGYEWYLNETHQLPADKLRGDELGSLLNLNRAVYLSFNALLEAARSVLAIDTPGG